MASTYSTRLRLENIANGDLNGTWGDATDNNICTLLEEAISGMASVTHSDAASYTLTASNAVSDEARCMIIKVGGTLTAQRNVVCPTAQKLYLVWNNTSGGYTITFKTSGGTGVDVVNGERKWLFCDGTNVVAGVSNLELSYINITGGTSLTAVDTADKLPLYDTSATSNKQATVNEVFKAVSTFTAETAVDTADVLFLYDASATTADKATVNEIFKAVNTFTAETAVDTADVLFLYDASASTGDKATVNELFKAVNTFTSETAVDTADVLYLYDASAATADKATVNELFKAVNTFTAETAVDSADVIPLYDASASTADKATVANLFKSVSTLTEDTTPDTANDFVLSYDASATAAKKVKISNLTSSSVSAASQAELETASSTSVYSSPGRQQYHPAHAKCWAYFSVSVGTPSMTTSHGFSSTITDNGTGDFTFTMSTAMSTTNFAPFVTIIDSTGAYFGVVKSKTTTTIRVVVFNSSGANVDPDGGFLVVYGDQ